ncbi:hypothetical protein BpHYR1_036148 [Brachionus plicatilis]|uniref:Uncharacterized protein n=1 Tax=Brachionus plicatilis TaxID=10195 RepID=A0A3M7PEH8_BRAPC|nr:hypothetical protein BpHYR1_036148 [Brachionus plicatilis]
MLKCDELIKRCRKSHIARVHVHYVDIELGPDRTRRQARVARINTQRVQTFHPKVQLGNQVYSSCIVYFKSVQVVQRAPQRCWLKVVLGHDSYVHSTSCAQSLWAVVRSVYGQLVEIFLFCIEAFFGEYLTSV